MFNHTPAELKEVCALALEMAKQKGASAAEADVSESLGQNVQARLQEIEHIERFFGTGIAYFEMQVRTTRTSAVAAQGYLITFFHRHFTFF